MFGFLFRRKSSDKGKNSIENISKKNQNYENDCTGSVVSIFRDSSTSESSPSSSYTTVRKSEDFTDSLQFDDLKWYSVSSSNSSGDEIFQKSLPNTTKNSSDEKCSTSTFSQLNDDDIEFIDETQQVDIDRNCDMERNGPKSTKNNLDIGIENEIHTERDLTDIEKKTMVHVDDFRSKLLTKDTEINLLQANINMLSANRDAKIVELEGLTTQVKILREENELSLITVRKIEIQLDDLLLRNTQLVQELLEKTESLKILQRECNSFENQSQEAENHGKELENELKQVRKENLELVTEHEAIEVEREEEMRALQNALDSALEQKIKIQHKYEYDFQVLRASCSSSEQQLMDDFEWKLRQIESSCKGKLIEKDLEAEEKLKEVRNVVEHEVNAEKDKLLQERRHVDEQMRQVCHYKAYEAELIQLRGLTHEQQRALRSAARQLEHFKFNEKLLHDEIRSSRILVDKEKGNIQLIQSTNQRRLEAQEESIHTKLDKQKNELNSKWEDRMRAECSRLKQDLCKLHAEEKHLAVESMKLQKDQELSSLKQLWDKQKQDLQLNISKLKDTFSEKESLAHQEVEKITALADKEIWELRRKLEKVKSFHEEELEKREKLHAKGIDSLQSRYDGILRRLNVVEVKLKEYQETEAKLNNTSTTPCSNEIEIKRGPLSMSSPVNQSDSGCGDDDDESMEDSDDGDSDDEDESEDVEQKEPIITSPVSKEDEHFLSSSSITTPHLSIFNKSNDETNVHHLREEVASLQGSIEKLTSELVVEPKNNNILLPETSSDDDQSEDEESND